VTEIADLTGYSAVWFYKVGIASILSLNNFKRNIGWPVNYLSMIVWCTEDWFYKSGSYG